MTNVILLGSTGSIGTQALDVIAHEGMTVTGLAAGGNNLELLAEQIRQTRPQIVGISRHGAAKELRELLAGSGQRPEIIAGADAATHVASTATPGSRVLNGITGSIGLGPTLAALDSGAILALANKESLVAGGALVQEHQQFPGQVVPVDSEHSAIAQVLRSGVHERGMCATLSSGKELSARSELRRIILTASGGPFRGKKRHELSDVTAEQALAHPTWAMGPVVTVNSSTLINKGLELIEAHLLFDVDPEDITVTVHPQSVIHSMVEWQDGSTIAQASPPDMRLPIALGLTWPEHRYPVRPVDWTEFFSWTFEPVDDDTFPAIGLARSAVAASATHPAVLNAANEEAVCAFLSGNVSWGQIVDTVARVLDAHTGIQSHQVTLEAISEAEAWARAEAHRILEVS